MPGYILCQNPLAREAYFIENIQMNIYSLEELCYYLRRNLYLVDESLLGEDLVYWISNELKLPGLGAKLKARLGKNSSLEEFLYPIFKEINYLSYEEMKKLGHEILTYQNQNRKQRLVCKGQAFMRNGMYMKAMGIFQNLLGESPLHEMGGSVPFPTFMYPVPERKAPEGKDAGEVAAVATYLEGLGLCSARLFQMEKACEYFWKAWELTGQEGFLEKSLLAYRALTPSQEFEAHLTTLLVPPQLFTSLQEDLASMRSRGDTRVEEEKADAYLDQFMKQYHRSMTPL